MQVWPPYAKKRPRVTPRWYQGRNMFPSRTTTRRSPLSQFRNQLNFDSELVAPLGSPVRLG